MGFSKQFQIDSQGVQEAPLHVQVRDSLNELAYKQEAQSAQERAMLAHRVWLNGNLVEQNGFYTPQITIQTEDDAALLEVALRFVKAAGFGGDGWAIQREPRRICLRGLTPFAGPQVGFIQLSGLLWEVCERTSLPYGAPIPAA